jgi:hypothetical protein
MMEIVECFILLLIVAEGRLGGGFVAKLRNRLNAGMQPERKLLMTKAHSYFGLIDLTQDCARCGWPGVVVRAYCRQQLSHQLIELLEHRVNIAKREELPGERFCEKLV